jgi:hypothetical protein
MPVVPRSLLVVASLLAGGRGLQAQAPTLPSDTLEANYAPRSSVGPAPELAPSLPSDTLEATVPRAPADSELRESPPPAVLPVSPDSGGSAERPSRAPWRLLPISPPPPRTIPARV